MVQQKRGFDIVLIELAEPSRMIARSTSRKQTPHRIPRGHTDWLGSNDPTHPDEFDLDIEGISDDDLPPAASGASRLRRSDQAA
jgi:hypothetical protein